ncbi:CdaR family transcriptional regulator [Paenibacillus xylanexedens]|uniref:PucR family transcriptional regulator n=1 Tax=Paenibacillus xylanexedens TaxID=528191 RepID=UPI001C8DC31C|nr:helix-turn-helix domain-containing protein [Paenibacillus xylanexedens]
MVKARVSMTFVDFTEDYWQKSGEIGIVPSTSIVVGLLEFEEWTGYQEADKALAYQKTRREQGTIRYTDIGVNRLFIRQPAEDLNAFMAEVFTSACKGQTGGLEETLMTYMACGGYAVQAAAALHIHINALYQRIHKIEEILGMSLSNQEHLLHRYRPVI